MLCAIICAKPRQTSFFLFSFFLFFFFFIFDYIPQNCVSMLLLHWHNTYAHQHNGRFSDEKIQFPFDVFVCGWLQYYYIFELRWCCPLLYTINTIYRSMGFVYNMFNVNVNHFHFFINAHNHTHIQLKSMWKVKISSSSNLISLNH